MISPLQYRDLLSSCEDQFFGKVLEIKATKGDVGIVQLVSHLTTFAQPQPLAPGQDAYTRHIIHNDDYTAHTLEVFFNFLVKKMRVFNRTFEPGDTLLSTDKVDLALSKIPVPELQDAIQKFSLAIGEQALSRKNDLRMKNLFFSVFIFCIKFTSKPPSLTPL